MKKNVEWICVNALGIALFVVLTMCLQVPVFENYYLCLGYVALVVFAGYYGAVSGMLIGCFGAVLYCLLTGGLRGMPGWTAGNLLIGAALGMVLKRVDIRRMPVWQYILFGLFILVITAAAMLGIKSLTESLLYAQPMAVRMAKNFYAFAADTVVMWAALPVYSLLKKHVPYLPLSETPYHKAKQAPASRATMS